MNPRNNSTIFDAKVLIAIALGGILLYFYPLSHAFFCFDDHISIENNPAVRHINTLKIFAAFNTRFLVGLSFALNYQFCKLNPFGYRLINFLIHCLNAFLVYLLIKSTLKLNTAGKPLYSSGERWPALFASMLFLCHPIQTEAVNFITQRFVLMGSFFYLSAIILYIRYRFQQEKRYIIASFGSAAAAMLCKEFTVTLPVMLVLYEIYFPGRNNTKGWKRWGVVAPFFIIALIVPLLLLRTPPNTIGVANIAGYNLIQDGASTRIGNEIDITRAHGGMPRKDYFLTELNVVCTYVRLLFLPFNLNFDYDYPLSHGLDIKTACCGVFLLCLLGLAAYRSFRLASFGILWFFLALSVESSFIPIADVINEYRVYLASAGFAMVVMEAVYRWKLSPKALNLIGVAVLICFSVMTLQRNKVWESELSLWNDTVRKSPHKARPYDSLGCIYNKEGQYAKAVEEYSKAIDVNPAYAEAYSNRGVAYDNEGKAAQAFRDYTRAIALNPALAYVYINRGTAYGQHGDFTGAIADINKAIAINPQLAEAYFNRGIAYEGIHHVSDAIIDYGKAIAINPAYADAYNNRANAYDDEANMSQAILDYSQAIAINPRFAQAYDNRGIDYADIGHWQQAMEDFSQAVSIDPGFAEAYNNRGVAYYKQKAYDRAWNDLKTAQKLGYHVEFKYFPELEAIEYLNKGQTDYKKGNFIQSVLDLTKAIAVNPRLTKAYIDRGLAYSAQGRWELAVVDDNKAIAMTPHDAAVYINRGYALSSKGNLTEAIKDYKEAVALNPKFADAYDHLGVIEASQGHFSHAVADFAHAIKLNPRFEEAYNNLGTVYDHQNQFDLAILNYSKSIAINPKFEGAYNNRGYVYAQQGKLGQAFSDLKKAIELYPDDPAVYGSRAFAYFKAKEYSKAWEDVCKAKGLGGMVDADFINALKDKLERSAIGHSGPGQADTGQAHI